MKMLTSENGLWDANIVRTLIQYSFKKFEKKISNTRNNKNISVLH